MFKWKATQRVFQMEKVETQCKYLNFNEFSYPQPLVFQGQEISSVRKFVVYLHEGSGPCPKGNDSYIFKNTLSKKFFNCSWTEPLGQFEPILAYSSFEIQDNAWKSGCDNMLKLDIYIQNIFIFLDKNQFIFCHLVSKPYLDIFLFTFGQSLNLVVVFF